MSPMYLDLQSPSDSYRINTSQRRGGGQAEVFPALNKRGERVAVRIALQGGEKATWLIDEARLLRDIAKREQDAAAWVVRVLDQGVTADGRPFMVLPWFEWTLSKWLKDHHPPIERILRALERACHAVARLHRGPEDLSEIIVHRDIKLDNFLVVDDGARLEIVLSDLGLGKRGHFLRDTENTGLFTRGFAPPEQQLPLRRPPDLRLDTHALAATIYTALAGRPPQAVVGRDGLWTEAATRLVALAEKVHRTAAEEEELLVLQRAPLGHFMDLEHARALHPGDEQRLLTRLEELLRDRVGQPAALAHELCGLLIPKIRQALEPDPERRASDARALFAACQEARTLTEETLSTTQHREAEATRPLQQELAPSELRRGRRMPLLVASSGVVVMVVLLYLAGPAIRRDRTSSSHSPGALENTELLPPTDPVVPPVHEAKATPAPTPGPEKSAATTEGARAPTTVSGQQATRPTSSETQGATRSASPDRDTTVPLATEGPVVAPAPCEVDVKLIAPCVGAITDLKLDNIDMPSGQATLKCGHLYNLEAYLDGMASSCGSAGVKIEALRGQPDTWAAYIDGRRSKATLRAGGALLIKFDPAGRPEEQK